MRALLVSQLPIWPATGGAQVRLDLVYRSLARLADVRLVSVESPDAVQPRRFDVATNNPVHLVPAPERVPIRRTRWWVDSERRPISLFTRDTRQTRAAAADLISGESFDVAWFSRISTYHWFSDLVDADLTIVDIDDLEADKRILEISNRLGAKRSPSALLRKLQANEDARRWWRLTESIGNSVRVVACRADDARKLNSLGLDAYVVPNCYQRTGDDHNEARLGLPDSPIVVMQGNFAYNPNGRGVEWLVKEVWPSVKLRVPDARLRLIGRTDETIERLADFPGVEVMGFVDDISVEIRAARVCVVPIHFGGGTRIKILEAFAYRRPVVSTTIGASGLEVRHDEDLLLADDPRSFADHVVQVLQDRSLAKRLSESGFNTWSRRYTPSQFHKHMVSVLSDHPSGDHDETQ